VDGLRVAAAAARQRLQQLPRAPDGLSGADHNYSKQ
jgi:hypothetical protein